MRRAPLIVVAIVVTVPLAAVAAAQFYLDGDALKARVEAAVQKATGRQLTISGPVRLGWSLTPTIEASDISLANPPGFSRPAIAHVDRISAHVALLPLLSRRVEVTGLTLTAPNVLLERDAQGRPNWEPSPSAPIAAPSPPSEPGQKFSVDVGEIAIRDATLAFRDIQVTAPHLDYDPGFGRVAGDVSFRSTIFHLAGVARPARFDLHVEGGGLKLALAGAYAAAGLVAEAADLSSLSTLAGTRLPPLRDVRLEAQAKLAPASFAFDAIKLTSAQGDLAGTLTAAFGSRPTLRGVLASTHFDLDALTPPSQPAVGVAPAPGPAPPAPDRIIPDTPIPYAPLRGADADLQLKAASLSWHGKSYTDVVAHLLLQDGKLLLDPFSMALGGKTIAAVIQADAGAQTVAAKIDAPGLPLAPLSALLGGPVAAGTLDLRADLRGQGATWRAVAATLQGSAGLATVDGEIDNAWVLDKLHDALRAANLPIPAGGDSTVRCAAVRLEVDAGKLRLPAFTLDTSKLRLESTGGINLADETLDLHLRPTLLLGAALSVPVHVGGTLRSPKAALDTGALTPGRVGISIGGPAPADTCGPALALARGGQPGPAPAPAPASRPPKPADLLRGLLR